MKTTANRVLSAVPTGPNLYTGSVVVLDTAAQIRRQVQRSAECQTFVFDK